jgi:hypothetical protein
VTIATNPAQQPDSPAGRTLRTVGLIGLLVGVVAAVVVWFLAGKRYDDAVADLAPAPVGCDTTLVFDRTGTFTFFVETKGRIGELEGDCGTDDREYEFAGDGLPRVSITLRDEGGDEVDLDRVSSPTYDRGGSRGEAVRTAQIDAEGEYTLTVDANADDVVVRVGGDPATGVTAMRIGAGALLLLGLGLGAVGLSSGRRGPTTPAGPAAEPWRPMPGQAPPSAPPYVAPPPAPPYAWPPAGPGAGSPPGRLGGPAGPAAPGGPAGPGGSGGWPPQPPPPPGRAWPERGQPLPPPRP